jgi:acylaminoacyl-peptidase
LTLRSTLAAFVALAALGAGAPLAEARPFTPKDLATLDRLSDPRVSPDGRFAAFQVRSTDWENNRGRTSIWLLDLTARGATPTRLGVGDQGANTPRWSADGRSLYFLSARSGSNQVWKTDLVGAEAVQVTDLPLDVQAFRLSPRGDRIVVALSVYPDCDSLQCSVDRAKATNPAYPEATGQTFDRVFVRHWDTWKTGERNHLFSAPLDADGVVADARGTTPADPATRREQAFRPLMQGFDGDTPSKPFGDDGDFEITPDGEAVVFSARLAGKTEPWSTNFDLWRVPIDGGEATRRTNNPAWDAEPRPAPGFSIDRGGRVAHLAMKRPGFEADRFAVMLRDYRDGRFTERELAPTWDRSAHALAWSKDGRTLFAIADDLGQGRIFAIDARTGAVKPLTGDGNVSGYSVGPDAIVYTREGLDGPAKLYRIPLRGGAPTLLFDPNAEKLKGVELGAFEQFSFRGWNGETVYGYVMKPVGWREGEKYPVAFIVHGGPQSSYANDWSWRWNPNTYAGAGYGVVFIDFHGSPGYGQAFTDSVSRDWGGKPLEDLQKGWAAALQRYPWLDGERACALGASYGGYMINWMAGNWKEPWNCFVNHDGVFDLRAMAWSTEELWFTEWENGGPAWTRDLPNFRFDPADHVAKWEVPMLVIHGQQDFRVPLEQSLATFNALQRKGIESRFLYFPDENHWVLKPQNSVQWHTEVQAWLDRHTGAR